ncbi:hypothetical protein V1477_007084 [Vespula maculifrons]|uniref:Uncharacterized protein n=1 Tax=Vespula maculifrons TaxID=7453 RepID=A0ABD2CHJ9_VESMC
MRERECTISSCSAMWWRTLVGGVPVILVLAFGFRPPQKSRSAGEKRTKKENGNRRQEGRYKR